MSDGPSMATGQKSTQRQLVVWEEDVAGNDLFLQDIIYIYMNIHVYTVYTL